MRYCSHVCNSKAYKEAKRKEVLQLTNGLVAHKRKERVTIDISGKEYLSISEAAEVIGVSRWTISREKQPIIDWYSINDITEKYGILKNQIRIIVNAEKIPETKDGTRTLIAKQQIDNYFKKKGFDTSVAKLAEWYTVKEITAKYGMTESAVRCFVVFGLLSTNHRPRNRQIVKA
ncbi:hypothetical protein FACS1894199_19410 [Bacteroidia bacterium]|nr:hypothetical protein FACS1894199_19410 [Bacteroidia bacterium]